MGTDPTGMWGFWDDVKALGGRIAAGVSSWYNRENANFKAGAKASGEATLAYYNKPYQVKSAAAVASAMKGDVKGYVKNLGAANLAAVKDPQWVAATALSVALAFVGPPAPETAGVETKVSPSINPAEIAGKTPGEIGQVAQDSGLIAKGSDPTAGKGAYIDPVTGNQRVLVHPEGDSGPHAHVNNPAGQRLDVQGNVVHPESPEAHLPLKKPNE